VEKNPQKGAERLKDLDLCTGGNQDAMFFWLVGHWGSESWNNGIPWR